MLAVADVTCTGADHDAIKSSDVLFRQRTRFIGYQADTDDNGVRFLWRCGNCRDCGSTLMIPEVRI